MHATINEEAINILTGTATDLYTCTPAYKQTMVKMRVLREKEIVRYHLQTREIKIVIRKMVLKSSKSGKENNTYHLWTRGGDSGKRNYFN